MTDVRFQVKFGPQDWRFYEDSANAVLADAYSRKERNTEVRIGRNGTYIVDFTSWSQFQKADPTKRRKVRIFDAKKSKPHHSHRHPTKSSSPSAHSKKSYDDPAKYIVEHSPYVTPSRVEGDVRYALVQDPDNQADDVAMMVRRVQLPKNHPTNPGALVIPYMGKYYLHKDVGPADHVKVTKIDGRPYGVFIEHKKVQEEQQLMEQQLAQTKLSSQQQPASAAPSNYYPQPTHVSASQGHTNQVPPVQMSHFPPSAHSTPPTYLQHRAQNTSTPPPYQTAAPIYPQNPRRSLNYAYNSQGAVQYPASALLDSYAQPPLFASPSRAVPLMSPLPTTVNTNDRSVPIITQMPAANYDDDSMVPSPRSYLEE